MRTSTILKAVGRMVVVLCTLLVASPARAAGSPDAWITTRAKLALFTANTANATMVHVDTVNGRVILYGRVTSAAQKQKAAGIVRGISGVTGVSNMLAIVDPAEVRVVEASDDLIKADVQKALDDDASLAGEHLSAKSVNKGVVLLAGNAANLSDALRAVECTCRVPGVRSVTSEISAPKEVAPYDLTPTAREVKETARDSWIVAATKMRFLGDSEVPVLDVGVDASHNVVTLFGMVPSETARAAAAEDVRMVDATVTIKNELQVVPARSKALVEARDDLVKKSVEKAIKGHSELRKVSVDVTDGVVRLTGTVESGWQRLKAGWIARSTRGVRAVQDDLTI